MSKLLGKISPLVKSRGFSTSMPGYDKKTFLVLVRDYQDPECLQRRKDLREKHLVVAKSLVSSGMMLLGGPTLDNHESGCMNGSVMLLNAESVEEINKMMTSDIYYKLKVWEKWDIYPYKGTIGTYLQGK